jgi:hypothetical protein
MYYNMAGTIQRHFGRCCCCCCCCCFCCGCCCCCCCCCCCRPQQVLQTPASRHIHVYCHSSAYPAPPMPCGAAARSPMIRQVYQATQKRALFHCCHLPAPIHHAAQALRASTTPCVRVAPCRPPGADSSTSVAPFARTGSTAWRFSRAYLCEWM